MLKQTGLDFTVLDAGCCGMAGAFGFEAYHYDVSMAAGERVLLPAVREAAADTYIVTNGFSCREQISQTPAAVRGTWRRSSRRGCAVVIRSRAAAGGSQSGLLRQVVAEVGDAVCPDSGRRIHGIGVQEGRLHPHRQGVAGRPEEIDWPARAAMLK